MNNEASQKAQVELIWNKGVAALCSRRIPDEFPNLRSYTANSSYAGMLASSKIPDQLISEPHGFRDLGKKEIIWVRLSWLKSFVKQALPVIGREFILVTGDSDACVPSEVMPEARSILSSPQVLHWYTQNYDGSTGGGKISPLPIGIDFHSLSERSIWGEGISSPSQQEETLKSIEQDLRTTESRIPSVYIDFAWRRSWGLRDYRRWHPLKGTSSKETRRAIVSRLRDNKSVVCQEGPLSRSEMWRRRGEYAFVLSPHGIGLDCHRTWEALALGHIVLVPSCSLDSLYHGLPVIALRSWDEITPNNLSKWLSLYPEGGPQSERLTSRYWIQRMESAYPDVEAPNRHPALHS